MTEVTWTLALEPKPSKIGYRTFELSSTVTSTTSSRGSAASSIYALQPAVWAKKVMDAAKERLKFLSIVGQARLGENAKDYFWPKRKYYLPDSSWETSTEEYAAGSEISWTQINTADAVQFTPTYYNYGVAISRKNILTNALDVIAYCREELAYKYENSVDSAIRDALLGTVGSSPTEPPYMTNTTNGAQTIFGGDATTASGSLDAGDVLTTDLIAKARRLLSSNIGYYWSSHTHAKSAAPKNAWEPTDAEPFVLVVAPEQYEALHKDSQFINAAEYGGREVVLTGEVGNYLGIKVIMTSKVPSFTNGSNIAVGGTTVSMDVDGHICGLFKAIRCGGIVWGREATITAFDWPNADQVRIKLSLAYDVEAIHPDAIVRIVVSDA